MAKFTKKISFKKAVIDFENMRISEVDKEEYREYDLKAILKDWNGIENISFTISTDDEFPEIKEDNEDDGE